MGLVIWLEFVGMGWDGLGWVGVAVGVGREGFGVQVWAADMGGQLGVYRLEKARGGRLGAGCGFISTCSHTLSPQPRLPRMRVGPAPDLRPAHAGPSRAGLRARARSPMRSCIWWRAGSSRGWRTMVWSYQESPLLRGGVGD